MITKEVTIPLEEYERLLRSETYLMSARTYIKSVDFPSLNVLMDMLLVTKSKVTDNGYQE